MVPGAAQRRVGGKKGRGRIRARPMADADDSRRARGLVIDLRSEPIQWLIDPATGNGEARAPRPTRAPRSSCGRALPCGGAASSSRTTSPATRCSRRTRPARCSTSSSTFADGQQLEEVYEYGSFVQSPHVRGGCLLRQTATTRTRARSRAWPGTTPCKALPRARNASRRRSTPITTGSAAEGHELRRVPHGPTRDYMGIERAGATHSLRVPAARSERDAPARRTRAMPVTPTKTAAMGARTRSPGWYPRRTLDEAARGARRFDAGRRGLPGGGNKAAW